jgi:hypothetical protein
MKENAKACDDLQEALDQGFTQIYGEEVNDLIRENCKDRQ